MWWHMLNVLLVVVTLGTTCTNELKQGERSYCESKFERENQKPVPRELRPRGFDKYEEDEDGETPIHDSVDEENSG